MADPITAEGLNAVTGDQFTALVPETLRSQPYMKDIKGFGDLFTKFDGAQKLLGQREAPGADATPDQWKAHHGKTALKTPDEYQVPTAIEGVPPEWLAKAAESKMIKPLLHAAQASPYQAQILLSGFLKMVYDADKAVRGAQDQKFTALSTEIFKDQKDAIVTNAKKFLAANVPDNVKPLLSGLDEKSLMVLIAATDAMVKKFTGEDTYRGGGGGGGGGSAETKDELLKQMQEIQKDPAYIDPFKDRVKHTDLKTKMEVIRGKLRKLEAGG